MKINTLKKVMQLEKSKDLGYALSYMDNTIGNNKPIRDAILNSFLIKDTIGEEQKRIIDKMKSQKFQTLSKNEVLALHKRKSISRILTRNISKRANLRKINKTQVSRLNRLEKAPHAPLLGFRISL